MWHAICPGSTAHMSNPSRTTTSPLASLLPLRSLAVTLEFTAELGSLRYHRIALSGEAQPNEWPGERYGREVAESKGRDERSRDNTLLDTLGKDFGEGMDPSIHRALALLGDPDRVRAPVHTPQLEGLDGPELERETYKWFEANEGRRQYLTALDSAEGLSDLQTLER
jgi:hypothetical protein